MTLVHRTSVTASVLLASLCAAPIAHAQATRQPAQSAAPLTGFNTADAQRERALEAKAATLASPADASALSHELSLEPHVAGTPAQARTRDIFARALREYGIEPEIRTYSIYMPHPTSVHLYRVSPRATERIMARCPTPIVIVRPLKNASSCA